MKKIKAYTLMELIVVMIITMIVVSITYRAFDVVVGQYRRFNANNEQVYTLLLLETLLTKDFNGSNHVLRVPGGVVCSYADRDVRYDFEDRWIVRTQSAARDTFHVAPENVEYHLLHGTTDQPGGYVDRMKFYTSKSGEVLSFVYIKQYGADVLMGEN